MRIQIKHDIKKFVAFAQMVAEKEGVGSRCHANMAMKGGDLMSRCSNCGKPIRFIHEKKHNESIAVNVTPVYFIPPNGVDITEWFINAKGCEVEGCRAQDGMTGYKRHGCYV